MAAWYYLVNGQKAGPLETDDLRKALAGRNLSVDTRVWTAGMQDWTPARDVLPPIETSPPVGRWGKPAPSARSVQTTPSALLPETVVFEAHYAPGLYYLFFAVVLAIPALGLVLIAAFNKSGMTINNAYLPPAVAKVVCGMGAAVLGLGAFACVASMVRGLFPPNTLKVTRTHLYLPRTFLFGSKRIALSSITKILERSHRGRGNRLEVKCGRHTYIITRIKLPNDKAYNDLKPLLARRGVPGAVRSTPWQSAPAAPAQNQPTRYRRVRSTRQLIGAIALIVGGGYYLMLSSQTLDRPTVVPLNQFEADPPANRQVIITGGHLDLAHLTRLNVFFNTGDTHPKITYFVPLISAGEPAPHVIVKIPEYLYERDRSRIDAAHLAGERLPDMELDNVVRYQLRQSFGPTADNMIVVEYGRSPQRWLGPVLLAAGVLLLFLRAWS